MADKANSTASASIFIDEVKSSMGGSNNYEPSAVIAASSGEGWVFSENSVDQTASTNILGTGDSYMGGASAVATGDFLMWVAIKNMSTTSTEGIGYSLDGGTAAYNVSETMILGPGEMAIFKAPAATVGDFHVRSCVLDGTYGYATSQGSTTVVVQIAAILKNVG